MCKYYKEEFAQGVNNLDKIAERNVYHKRIYCEIVDFIKDIESFMDKPMELNVEKYKELERTYIYYVSCY